MKQIFKLKRIYLLLLLPLSLLLVLLARLNNVWVEKLYVPYIYKPLSFVVGTLVSLFPFSVTELLILLAAAGAIWYIVCCIIRMVKDKSTVKQTLLKAALNIACVLSVALFLFELCMGLNYYRFEVKKYLGLEITERSKEELYRLCEILVNDMNESRAQLSEDRNGTAQLSDDSMYAVSAAARDAYKKLSEKYPVLKSANIRNKPLLSSKLFSAVLTTGIYIPYTFESNINVDVPAFTVPVTMCHELTHYRGFMRENEANFLGYLACLYSGRADFKYSASLMAFGYAYTQLHKEDAQLAGQLARQLDGGILTDIAFEDEYWDRYRGTPAADISSGVYEGYLGANGQTSGLKSYGEMVDLLLAYYE